MVLRQHLETICRSRGKRLPGSVNADVGLYESGYLDSLSGSEFLMLAEKSFGVPLPDWLLGAKASSLAKLAAYIEVEGKGQK